jgi:hypothetical protein
MLFVEEVVAGPQGRSAQTATSENSIQAAKEARRMYPYKPMEETDGSVSAAESALPGTVIVVMYVIPKSGQSSKEGNKRYQRDGEDDKSNITDEAH